MPLNLNQSVRSLINDRNLYAHSKDDATFWSTKYAYVFFYAKCPEGGSGQNYIGKVEVDIWKHESNRGAIMHIMKVSKLFMGWEKGGIYVGAHLPLLHVCLTRYYEEIEDRKFARLMRRSEQKKAR